MTHAALYKYISCTVGKLLALALATNYITNYSIMIITTPANNNNNNNNILVLALIDPGRMEG